MNIIISLIYSPFVFFSLRYFDIDIVSILLFYLSFVWFVFSFRISKKEALYPLLYICISLAAFIVEDFLFLKSIPLILSTVITSIILISYINKTSVILYFAKKFSKSEISKNEEEYIKKSTLFWITISFINIIFHLFVFMNDDMKFWVYYSSIGWYILFIIAGLGQFLHRKFIFLKKVEDVS